MVVACLVDRDVIRIAGPEATGYLQGQLSQDVEALQVGASARSFVLQPTGKVDAWVRVTRVADDDYVVDVDGGHQDALLGRLRRFLLRTKAEIQPLDWRCLAFRGDEASRAAAESGVDAELRLPADWPEVEGIDLLGPRVAWRPAASPGTVFTDCEAYEALRISAGVPAMSAELTEKTIPAEAGQWVVDTSVSFTKGCFTGQELVARIDSRGGNVPRQLRGLLVHGAAAPPAGATLQVDGGDVGTLTSSAAPGAAAAGENSALPAGPVALAYVRRSVDVPAEGVVTWPDGEVTVSVRALPLLARGAAGA
jgi:tRNA-modifying protein YgfZ